MGWQAPGDRTPYYGTVRYNNFMPADEDSSSRALLEHSENSFKLSLNEFSFKVKLRSPDTY